MSLGICGMKTFKPSISLSTGTNKVMFMRGNDKRKGMFHQLLVVWFHWVRDLGYGGVIFLMALESSIFPVPSEVVMPPAAFWAAQGKMNFWAVVLAGTFGGYLGSIASYFLAQAVGLPLIKKYGKYFLLGPDKLQMAEAWVKEFGITGVFVARLLPVVRHLISIPAGILKMDFKKFSIATVLGAFTWCLILSWFGQQVLGDQPELLSSPEALVAACKAKLQWFIIAVLAFVMLYAVVVRFKRRVTIKS